MQSVLLEFGVRVVVVLHGLGGWLTLPMHFFSFLASLGFSALEAGGSDTLGGVRIGQAAPVICALI